MSTDLADPFALVGTKLDGQYRIEQVVGEGGFGVVYRGWHEALEQPIAIKALKVIAAEDRAVQDALFAKFKDEAKLLYTLSQASLHIVRSMDFGAVTSPAGLWAPYMVLEWLEGRSLADDLTARRRQGMHGRSLDEALAILEPAAEGLSVAHQRKVAHRDVKPANFFLLAQQEGPRVKVLDFGIAKIVRDGDNAGTRSPFASFTWLYAAPEQLDPRVGQTGLATDVYSFALVLTELLTDRPPVEGRDVVSLLKASTDPTMRPTPRQRGANVPDAIEVVCRRALAVDPRARHGSIAELWAELSSARRGAASTSSLPSAADASGRYSATPATKPSEGQAAPMSQVAAPGSAPANIPSHHGFPAGPPPAVAPIASMPSNAQPNAQPSAPHVPAAASWAQPASAYAPSPHGAPSAPHVPAAPAAPYAAYDPATAAALSPPRMIPPPGTTVYGQRRLIPQASSAPLVLAILGIVLGLMFVGTCAVVHAACN